MHGMPGINMKLLYHKDPHYAVRQNISGLISSFTIIL